MNDNVNTGITDKTEILDILPPDVKPPEKNKKKSQIILIIILIAVLSSVGYIVYNNYFSNAKKTEAESEIDVTSDVVINTFYKYINGYSTTCNRELEFYFKDKELNNTDIENKDAFDIALKLIMDEKSSKEISGDDILNKVKLLFGNDYSFNHQTFNENIPYEDGYYKIVKNADKSCSASLGDLYKIVAAKKHENELELEVRVLFNGDNKYIYYSDYNKENVLNTFGDLTLNNSSLLDEDYTKGSLYKIVFSKNNDEYVFKTSSLIESPVYENEELEITDIDIMNKLNVNTAILESMSQNNFIIPNLYKEDVEELSDEQKLLIVLMYSYNINKFTNVLQPSENIAFYANAFNLTEDKLVGSLKVSSIIDIYDSLFTSNEESLNDKMKTNFTSTCPTFIYDAVADEYYAYLTCEKVNDIMPIGYNYKYSVFKDVITVNRAVGYIDNNIIHTSYNKNVSLDENTSKSFTGLTADNYNDFSKFAFKFSINDSKEFRFVSVSK